MFGPRFFVLKIRVDNVEKVCSKCGVKKSSHSFYRSSKTKDGLQGWCKDCSQRASAQHAKDHPEKRRVYKLSGRYRITTEQYDLMLAAQQGVCAICRLPDSDKLSVDHCHATGVVRGLLCGNCNRGLGIFRDDSDALRRAAEYIEGVRNAELPV